MHYNPRHFVPHPDIHLSVSKASPTSHSYFSQRLRLHYLDWGNEEAPPLLLVHGLADDNVVMAHTLALSRALLEAGRPHRVLPLSGVTHMTPQESVAENLLRLQLDFLAEALGMEPRPE